MKEINQVKKSKKLESPEDFNINLLIEEVKNDDRLSYNEALKYYNSLKNLKGNNV